MRTTLISTTPNAEQLIGYCARVSSDNQSNPEVARLLRYCIDHGHWSVFEQAYMTIEIETSRAISMQILRHKSFDFQQHSQRYAAVQTFEPVRARRQAEKNRQSSVDDLSDTDRDWWDATYNEVTSSALKLYNEALSRGIAKECARFLLPESSSTKMYMTGNIRSWIHYIQLRTKEDTQLEHREIAEACKAIFVKELPIISEALGW